MKGKKYALMLTLTFLLGAIVASVPPVKASSTVKIYVKPEFPSYITGVPSGSAVDVELWIESPPEWDDTANGIVGWALEVHVDPAVLRPLTIYGMSSGYWLYDFIANNWYFGHEPKLLFGVDATAGNFTGVSEFIFGWETLGVGAGGSGKLCTLRFGSYSETAYSIIDLFDVYYYTPAGKFPVDIVVDGHYNMPPFKFLHAVGSLIDPSAPVGTTWHELYPEYCTTSTLNDWADNGDGILSRSDNILLGADWYHVEEVTVTLEIHWRSKGKDYYRYVEFLGWQSLMDQAIDNPLYTLWHEVAGVYDSPPVPDPASVFCTKYNLTSWTDADGDTNLTIGDSVELTDVATGTVTVAGDVTDVATDIIIGPPVAIIPEFPLGAALEIGLIAAIAYIWWRSKRKTKITKQAIPAHGKR